MTRDELLKRLAGFEWNDFEAKKAQNGAPAEAYVTVSAFSNTAGGWLVFGVKQASDKFEIVGVLDVDKVQNEFISTLRSKSKFNRALDVRESAHELDGKQVLVFYVPEVPRRDKPIYLDNSIAECYRRIGGCDVKCTLDDIKAFLRDASDERYDCEALDCEVDSCFDKKSLTWYRSVYASRGQPHDPSATDLDFLRTKGFLRERHGRVLPTRAAILLFGTEAVVRQALGRPLVDCQKISSNHDDPQPAERWSDRVVLEQNLMETWRAINEWYLRHAEKPFSLDSSTLQRTDAPPDQEAFREAAVNLLIHQDYSDESRIPSIKFFRDAAVFYNPGHAFATDAELLTPGDKEVRNQLIRTAFRMVGFGEQGGTGIPAMMRRWQQLGYFPPRIRNDKEQRSFQVSMLRELLLSEEQILFQSSLGVSLTENEAKLFAFICTQQQITEIEAKTVLSLPAAETRKLLDRLVVQALVVLGPSGSSWHLVDHLRERFAEFGKPAPEESMVTDQARQAPKSLVTDHAQPERKPLTAISDTQARILEFCTTPRSVTDLLKFLKLTSRPFFRKTHLMPLIDAGVLQLKFPEKPQHPRQAYFLTETGIRLLDVRRTQKKDQEQSQ